MCLFSGQVGGSVGSVGAAMGVSMGKSLSGLGPIIGNSVIVD